MRNAYGPGSRRSSHTAGRTCCEPEPSRRAPRAARTADPRVQGAARGRAPAHPRRARRHQPRADRLWVPRGGQLAVDVGELVEDELELVRVQHLERADLLFEPPEALGERVLAHSTSVPRCVTIFGSPGRTRSA